MPEDPVVRHAEVGKELLQGRAAAQPDVLADIDFAEVWCIEGEDPAAEVAVFLQERGLDPGAGQRQCRADARDAATDNRDLHH